MVRGWTACSLPNANTMGLCVVNLRNAERWQDCDERREEGVCGGE